MANPYENVNLFGQPHNRVPRSQIYRTIRQNRQQFQGLSIRDQVRVLAGLIFGSGAATQIAVSSAYRLSHSSLRTFWRHNPPERSPAPSPAPPPTTAAMVTPPRLKRTRADRSPHITPNRNRIKGIIY